MFDSVLDRGVAPRRRLATGAVFSIFGHAAVLSLALLVRPPAVVEKVADIIRGPVIFQQPPLIKSPLGPAGKGGVATAAGQAHTRKRHDDLFPKTPPKSIDLDVTAPPNEVITGVVISDTDKTDGPGDGPDTGDGPGDGSGGDGECSGIGCNVRGMVAPKLLQRGREPDYTQEALEAHVQGLMTVECVVTLEGRLQQCHALQSLPYMERAVVEALMTRRYSPATLHGHALPVRYVFNVKLVMPK